MAVECLLCLARHRDLSCSITGELPKEFVPRPDHGLGSISPEVRTENAHANLPPSGLTTLGPVRASG